MKNRKGEKVLSAVRPNLGIQAAYRRKLECLIQEMHRSICWWVKSAYKATPPAMMAMDDATAASQMRIAINKLVRQWNRNFDQGSRDLAKYFALAANKRSDAALRAILKKAGFSVKFTMTPAMRDILKATISENTFLIKSIPQQYLTQVSGAVMRSVVAGRDLGSLAKELEQQYGVVKRRAAFISLDQNNKATSAFTRARQIELGISAAVWLHSHAGRQPRKTHLANSGERYDPKRGWYDPDPKVRRFIFPGELPRCRCVSKSVVKGFS